MEYFDEEDEEYDFQKDSFVCMLARLFSQKIISQESLDLISTDSVRIQLKTVAEIGDSMK